MIKIGKEYANEKNKEYLFNIRERTTKRNIDNSLKGIKDKIRSKISLVYSNNGEFIGIPSHKGEFLVVDVYRINENFNEKSVPLDEFSELSSSNSLSSKDILDFRIEKTDEFTENHSRRDDSLMTNTISKKSSEKGKVSFLRKKNTNEVNKTVSITLKTSEIEDLSFIMQDYIKVSSMLKEASKTSTSIREKYNECLKYIGILLARINFLKSELFLIENSLNNFL